MNELLPPQNLQAEKMVLSGMLQSETIFWNAIGQLIEDMFYSTSYRKCFSVFAKTKSRDFINLQNAFSDNIQSNFDPFNGPSFDPMQLYDFGFSATCKTEINLIIDCYKRRIAIETCQTAVNALFVDFDTPATETMSNTVLSLTCANLTHVDAIKRIGELVPAELERCERVSKGERSAFIETGISDIDSLLCIEQHDYIPVGARPSNGKSLLMSQICRNISKTGKICAYFCLDSSRESEVSRALFSESGVCLSTFNRGINTKKDLIKINEGAAALINMPLYFLNPRKATPDIIYAYCQRVKSIAGGLHTVVIDFMQNVKYKARDIREKVSLVSEELHHMAKDLACPVFPLSQLRRYQNEEHTAPTLKDLKESGDIEEDADKVILLWYPEKYPQNQPSGPNDKSKDQFKNLLHFCVDKNKNGSTGLIELTIFADKFRVVNRINEPDNKLKGFIEDEYDY